MEVNTFQTNQRRVNPRLHVFNTTLYTKCKSQEGEAKGQVCTQEGNQYISGQNKCSKFNVCNVRGKVIK